MSLHLDLCAGGHKQRVKCHVLPNRSVQIRWKRLSTFFWIFYSFSIKVKGHRWSRVWYYVNITSTWLLPRPSVPTSHTTSLIKHSGPINYWPAPDAANNNICCCKERLRWSSVADASTCSTVALDLQTLCGAATMAEMHAEAASCLSLFFFFHIYIHFFLPPRTAGWQPGGLFFPCVRRYLYILKLMPCLK